MRIGKRRIDVAIITLASAFVQKAPAAAPPVFQIESEVAVSRGIKVVPEYNNGWLVTYDFDTASIWTADKHGRVIMELTLALPGVSQFHISDVAARSDGTIAVTASAVSDGRWTGLILWFTRSGTLLRAVKTAHFGIYSLAFTSDGTLWTVGHQTDELYKPVPEHHLIRRYDQDGRLIDFLLPLSSIAPGKRGAVPPGHECRLAPGPDRMGLFCAQTGDWLEFNLAGEIVKRVKVTGAPPATEFLGAAILNGQVYLCGQGPARWPEPGIKLYSLDETSARLTLVNPARTEDQGRAALIVGVDKDKLVTLSDNKLVFSRVAP